MARDQRRLAAIVSADVAGYSRLMGRDESDTLAALKAHRRELIDPKIAEYGGRIVKTSGDGLLLEFPSVVEAVRCAVDVQRGMAERNAGVSPEQRIEFRVGVNVGDIIIDGEDIFGDGVNVAARLQALSEPGAICVSRAVRDQVLDKLSFNFEELGAQQVKNIARPVEVYRVELSSAMPEVPRRGRRLSLALSRRWQWLGAGVVAVGIAGIVVWAVPRFWSPVADRSPPAMSMVVVPLAAAQGDPEAVRFAEALTSNLVSRLGRVTGWAGRLRMVRFNGDPASRSQVSDPAGIGRRHDARYVVEGNVTNIGGGNTVNLQLIDTATGVQVWSERAAMQASDISGPSGKLGVLTQELRFAVMQAERRRVLAKPLSDLTAPELLLRAAQGLGRVACFDTRSAHAGRQGIANGSQFGGRADPARSLG